MNDNVKRVLILGGGDCGVQHASDATDLPDPSQQPGDCQKLKCDGSGGVVAIEDDADLPDDSNDCTSNACSMGEAVFDPMPLNTACGSGMY